MDPISALKQQTGIKDDKIAASFLERAEGDVELASILYQSTLSSQPAPTTASSAPKPKPKPLSGGVMTMAEINKLNTGDSDSDSDDEKPDYYAGGSKDSGVQIKDPRKKPSVNKIVENVFDKARQSGAKTDEEIQAEQSKSFGGSGYRLGDQAGPARPTVVPKAPERISKVITFYRQGFVIDDGPLRPYNDPNNARFLREMDEGYVPSELEAEAAGRELQTQLIDKKHEDYKEPEKPKVVAFSGTGHSLSSSSSSSSTPVAPKASSNFVLDPNAPTLSVQVRFHDGSKATAKLNTTHTIMDLRSWIETNKPTPSAYDLLIAFPPKPLNDLNQTVSQAGLSGAAVIQKLR